MLVLAEAVATPLLLDCTPGVEVEQRKDVAVNQWQRGDFGGLDGAPDFRSARVDIRRSRADGHKFARPSDRKGDVEARRVADLQDDSGSGGGLETGGGDLQSIVADRHELEAIGAFFTGRDGSGEGGLDVADSDMRAGDYGPVGVFNGADDGGRGALRRDREAGP